MAEGFDEKKKRKRSANWDYSEKHLLRTCMREFIKIIENKNTDTNTNRNKNTAWIQLTQRFNELNDKERTFGEVKQQWRTMKLDAKKELSIYKRQLNGTGGGPKPPSPGQETNEIYELIPQEFEVDSNTYDSDGTVFKSQKILSQVDLASPSNTEPILIEDSNINKQERPKNLLLVDLAGPTKTKPILIKDSNNNKRERPKNLLLVDLAGPTKTKPILIKDSNNNKRETITTPLASKHQNNSHQTSNNEVRTNRKRKLYYDAPEDSLEKEHNSVLIECIKKEHDLKMKQMIESQIWAKESHIWAKESHIWGKDESELRIENLKLDLMLKTKLIDN